MIIAVDTAYHPPASVRSISNFHWERYGTAPDQTGATLTLPARRVAKPAKLETAPSAYIPVPLPMQNFVEQVEEILEDIKQDQTQEAYVQQNRIAALQRLFDYPSANSEYMDRAYVFETEDGGITLEWENYSRKVHLVLDAGQPDQDYIYVKFGEHGKVFADPNRYRLNEMLQRLYAGYAWK